MVASALCVPLVLTGIYFARLVAVAPCAACVRVWTIAHLSTYFCSGCQTAGVAARVTLCLGNHAHRTQVKHAASINITATQAELH
jgi:hypothetical protein